MDRPLHLSREELRALDARAIAELGIPGVVLMENAGRQAAELLLAALRQQLFAGRRAPAPWRVAVVCGTGNNGGDGYVLARHVQRAGHAVECWATGAPTTVDARTNHAIALRLGIRVCPLSDAGSLASAAFAWEHCDALVDGLLGTGLRGAPRAEPSSVIAAMNGAGRPFKLALDVPSGLNCDEGVAVGACFRADLTVTFAARKLGFAGASAAPFLGSVRVADLGFDLSALGHREGSNRP
ncbi:MAG: NAD(P)H-hydrate epimerase [Planctomycetes bacterium]|nr:NAD(P)H-hydrate epimerase [Planctomycetota bacterium]